MWEDTQSGKGQVQVASSGLAVPDGGRGPDQSISHSAANSLSLQPPYPIMATKHSPWDTAQEEATSKQSLTPGPSTAMGLSHATLRAVSVKSGRG